jgi:hypothetical protein
MCLHTPRAVVVYYLPPATRDNFILYYVILYIVSIDFLVSFCGSLINSLICFTPWKLLKDIYIYIYTHNTTLKRRNKKRKSWRRVGVGRGCLVWFGLVIEGLQCAKSK